MVLREDTIGQTFLLPQDIRTMIPDDHVCFFIEKLVNCVDFSEIDFLVCGYSMSEGLSCCNVGSYYYNGYYIFDS